jgi:hypothetical protein
MLLPLDLKMEATCPFEMMVCSYKPEQCDNEEGYNINSHHNKYIKA